jgi:hypothetical protein
VAQEFATSSTEVRERRGRVGEELTGAVVVCIKHSKDGADGKDVRVVGEHHLDVDRLDTADWDDFELS